MMNKEKTDVSALKNNQCSVRAREKRLLRPLCGRGRGTGTEEGRVSQHARRQGRGTRGDREAVSANGRVRA